MNAPRGYLDFCIFLLDLVGFGILWFMLNGVSCVEVLMLFMIRIACFKFSVYQGKWIGYWLCYLMKGGHLDSLWWLW